MDAIYSTPKWLMGLSALLVIFLSGMLIWQYRSHNGLTILSEKQTIWLLIGLLIIAAISMGLFLLTILGWQWGINL